MSYHLGVVLDQNDPAFDPNVLTPEQWQQSAILAAASAAAGGSGKTDYTPYLIGAGVLAVGAALFLRKK